MLSGLSAADSISKNTIKTRHTVVMIIRMISLITLVLYSTSPNPFLLRRGKVLPLHAKGESAGVAHAIAKFQISLAILLLLGKYIESIVGILLYLWNISQLRAI